MSPIGKKLEHRNKQGRERERERERERDRGREQQSVTKKVDKKCDF